MNITLVRHGEVEETYQGCYNGHNNIGLSLRGHKQAKDLSLKLSSKNFDAIYCSDLPRAIMTLEHLSYKQEIIFTDILREKSWGKHEGMKFDEIVASGEVKYENFIQWIEALDGEPYEQFTQRIEKFFLSYLPSQNKKNILVMTHAGVIRTLISIVKNISLEEVFSIKVNHTSFIVYNSTDDTFTYGDSGENI